MTMVFLMELIIIS